MLSARERDNKAKFAARDFFIQRKEEEEEEEEKNKRILGNVCVCVCLLGSTGLHTWMSTSFFVGISSSSIIGFTSLTTSIVMGGFRRVEINHMSFFDVFTFRNVDNGSFREKRFERLKQRTNDRDEKEPLKDLTFRSTRDFSVGNSTSN